MNIEEILAEVPDYKAFKTVDELKESSRQLAEDYPGVVELNVIGTSKNGEEIEALKIGDGSKKALLFACPHPNEPIGSMMLDFLSEKMAADDGLREELDVTWYIIKCIDPDGTRLNEGWFKGPFTPENYASNFYRPAGFEQVEWTFPINYKTLNFNEPIPETRALMKIIEEVRPDFMYSLHNAGFGGVYYYISEPRPELYEPFRQLALERDLPLSLGEPEMPYAKEYSDAIYQLPSTKDSYDYLAEYTDRDPAEIISAGTSSFDYLKRFNDRAFTLVCEMPYFYDSRIEDLTDADISRKDAVLESTNLQEKMLSFIKGILDEVRDLLAHESPFKTAVDEFIRTGMSNIEAKRNWARTTEELKKPATVAQKFDNLTITKFYSMLVLGMTARLLEYEIKQRSEGEQNIIEKLEVQKRKVMDFFAGWNEKLEAELDYEVIPIRKLVQVQLGSALEAIKTV